MQGRTLRFVGAVVALALFSAVGVGDALANHRELTLTPEVDTNPVGTQHCVEATYRAHGAVGGVPIVFTVSGANTATGTMVTANNGKATFCYVGTKAGVDMISAFADANANTRADAGEPTAMAQKTWNAGPPATVTASPPAATNPVGTQHCVTATLRDQFANPTSGVIVRFTVTGANATSGAATTNTSGIATFCYTGTTIGTDTITVHADTDGDNRRDLGEPLTTATKTYVSRAPASVVLTPQSDTNRTGEQHCVTATVTDQTGNPVPAGTPVVFSVAGANTAGGTATTNAGGQAQFCYTGTRAGVDTITAFADDNRNGRQDLAEPSGGATKTYTPGDPVVLTLHPPTAENQVGTQHCVIATARDAFGNPTPGVAVRFAVSGVNSVQETRTTDANGTAVFCYIGRRAGTDTIDAFADSDGDATRDLLEPGGSATKLWHAGTPTRVVVTPLAASNLAGEEHCVTATVYDEFSNPVPNVLVAFAVTGANAAGGTDTTDAAGAAGFCYTGTTAGVDTIRATADADGDGAAETGEPFGTGTKTYGPAQAATLTLDPPAATNRAGEEHCVTARVTDAFGNPVGAGVAVVFAVEGVNDRGATTVRTNTAGEARFCYTGTAAGADTITAFADRNDNASLDAGEPTGTATKVYGPGQAATVSVSPTTATNPAGDEHCVTAAVADEFGNPVEAGVAVRFEVSGANTAADTTPTNAAGEASFCYTGTAAGADTIRATADSDGDGRPENGEATGAATKIYTPADPATVVLSPTSDTNRTGEQHCVTATVQDAFGNATPGVTVFFSVAGANVASGRDDTNAAGQAEFCYTGRFVGTDAIRATADADDNGTPATDEPMGAATKVYRPGRPASVEVTPPAAQNRAGEQHCVTATVRDEFANTVDAGVRVEFQVVGVNPTGPVLRTTDERGQAEFCYTGTRAGVDTIRATADGDEDGTVELGEPTGAAEKTYAPAQPKNVLLEPVTAVNRAGERHCVTATVTDAFANPTPGVAVQFTVTGANTAGGRRTTDSDGRAEFCYTGTRAGTDAITAIADTDEDGTPEAGEATGAATKVYRPGRPAAVTADPAAAVNRAGEEHCVTATVRDEFGNPVEAGVAVSFDVNGVNDRPAAIRQTDPEGEATFCYTGQTAGPDEITIVADGDEDGQPEAAEPATVATKTYRPGRPTAITLTPAADTNRAGEEHCVTATVRDEFGNAVEAGVKVEFQVTGVNPRGPAVRSTDGGGQAEFCYTGTAVGPDTIRAIADGDEDGTPEAGEPTSTATKLYRPGRPALVTVAPPTAENRAGQEHCVTATVTDEFGNPVEAGVAVSFDVNGVNDRAPVGTQTDENGQARFCYTGTRVGADEITVIADSDEDGTPEAGEATGAATKVYGPGQPATVLVTPPADENRAGEEHCVTATVRDAFGNPVRQGTAVEFDVTGPNDQPAAIRTTDAEGEATYCYTGRTAGLDTIRATADGDEDRTPETGEPTGEATKLYRPARPATVVVSPATAMNTAGQQHCVTATVRDEFGNRVEAGVKVVFTVTGANTASRTTATNDHGDAEFCYRGTRAGLDTITANADGNEDGTAAAGEQPSGTATKTYRPGAPATVTVAPPAAVNTAGEEHCVTATVRDEFGNAVDEAYGVYFSVAGANPRPATRTTTNDEGRATFCYTGTVAGEDVITAVVDANRNSSPEPTEPAGTATKTYEPGPPSTLSLTPKAAVNPVDSQHCVTATVQDAFGNPNPRVTVRFSVTGSVTRTGTGTTDDAGRATFCYRGPPLPGADAIRAYADTDRDGMQDPGEPLDVAEKTWALPASTPGCEVTITQGGWILAANGDRASFGGNAKVDGAGNVSGSENYQDHGPAQPLHVKSTAVLAVVCSADRKQASVYGKATVDGAGDHHFRIQVVDLGEPGTNDTYGMLLDTGYYSGEQRLQGGNVQIR